VKPLLSVGSLLLSLEGRVTRSTLWWTSIGIAVVYVLALPFADRASPSFGVPALNLVVLYALIALSAKRLKDRGRSPWWLLAAAVPILGPLWLFVELGLRAGNEGENHYGPDPRDGRKTDYLVVPSGEDENTVVDVTGLYATDVFAVATPETLDELVEAVKRTEGPISIGGGRFSMGGQVASEGSLHIDMRQMNRVLALDFANKTIRVQAGIRWCDIQRVVDPHDLAVKIMQTYAAPTMGQVDVLERGQLAKLGEFVPLEDYRPIPPDAIADASVDLVTVYIGLHHIEPSGVEPFLRSIHRVLRPGGLLVVRDHDVTSPEMDAVVSLAHTVFNIGLGETWAFNQAERRHFAPVETWVERIERVGFRDLGPRLYQELDPTRNALFALEKVDAAEEEE